MVVKDFKPYEPAVQVEQEKLIKDMVERFVDIRPCIISVLWMKMENCRG